MKRQSALLTACLALCSAISHATVRRAAVVIDAAAEKLSILERPNPGQNGLEGKDTESIKRMTNSAIATMELLLSTVTGAQQWDAIFDCRDSDRSAELVAPLESLRVSAKLQNAGELSWQYVGRQSTSCLQNTSMAHMLLSHQIDELYVMGFTTEQSIFATMFDAWQHHVVQNVFLVTDAVASLNGVRHHSLGIDMARATMCGDLNHMDCPSVVQSASIHLGGGVRDGVSAPPSILPVNVPAPALRPASGFLAKSNSGVCDTSWHLSPFLGTNLGGWLVAENWIWPSQMRPVNAGDEWTLIQKLGGPSSSLAQATLKNHWDTFVSEADLDRLKSFGVSHLRIPIGYWLLDYDARDGFVDGGRFYLDRVIAWMKRRCMLAVFDLHALPGGQEVHESFTGRSVDTPEFFLNSSNYERGKEAVYKMADLLLSYERDESTSGVVLGLSPVNEPSLRHWEGARSQQEFYNSVVTRMRDPSGGHYLDPSRYTIYLNYMGRANQMVDWLKWQPWSRSNIVLDKHVYHKFDTKCDLPATSGGLQDAPHLHPGDDHGPKCEWPKDSDSCKSCCRDRWFLEPVIAASFPVIVGEWSVATLTESPVTSEFRQKFFKQQLALYAETPRMQGSFFWSFKTEEPEEWKEWCLMRLFENDFQGKAIGTDFSFASTCPHSLDQCPDFSDKTMENSLWKATCEWQDLPCATSPVSSRGDSVVNSGDKISLVVSNGKVLYVEGEMVRLRCAPAGAYQELYIQKQDESTTELHHGDVVYLKADAITWDNDLYYLEVDWDPSAPGMTDLARAKAKSIHAKGQEWTAQAFTVERAGGPGLVRSGDIVHLRTLMHKLLGGFHGDTVKSSRYEPSHSECFTIIAI